MGSQQKKKKGTDDVRIVVADIKDKVEQEEIRTVLRTGLDMINSVSPRIPLLRTMIDFVNVTETTDPTQGTGGAPAANWGRTLWLQLDNSYTDTSGFSQSTFSRIAADNTPAFATPGKFGTHFAELNWPNITTPSVADHLGAIDDPDLELDMGIGFSYSLWIQPKDLTAVINERYVFLKKDSSNNAIVLFINDSGQLCVWVNRSGVGTFSQLRTAALVVSTWYHVAITFDAATNTLILYTDKVAGVAGVTPTAAVDYTNLVFGHNSGSPSQTYYQGYLDEIMYFKQRVLTQADVNLLFSSNTT